MRRARKNKINKLVDLDGNEHTDPKDMGAVATPYFENLFQADTSLNPEPILNLFHAQVDDDTNQRLCADFSDDKIADALFQIGPLKASGPDG